MLHYILILILKLISLAGAYLGAIAYTLFVIGAVGLLISYFLSILRGICGKITAIGLILFLISFFIGQIRTYLVYTTTPDSHPIIVPVIDPLITVIFSPPGCRLKEGTLFIPIFILFCLFWKYRFGTYLPRSITARLRKIKIPWLNSSQRIRLNVSNNNELGSGRLALSDELEEKKYTSALDHAGGMLLENVSVRCEDREIKTNIYWPPGERAKHCIAVGKPGGGKTSEIIIPFAYYDVLRADCTTIILDTKMELWRQLSYLAQRNGKRCLLFNPTDLERTLCWNFISHVDSIEAAQEVANTFIQATGGISEKEPFFANNAEALLTAIIIGMNVNEPQHKSFGRAYDLIQKGLVGLSGWLEQIPEAKRIAGVFVESAKQMDRNMSTVLSELNSRMKLWADPKIKAVTSKNEIDLNSLIAKPSLFVIEVPESRMDRLRPLVNVLISELIRFLLVASEKTGKTPLPVGFILDEFASAIGKLPDIEKRLNTTRSRGISFVAAVQTFEQLTQVYDKAKDTIIAGFGTQIFFPSLEINDAEFASKKAGMRTVNIKLKGKSGKITELFSTGSDSENKQAREVLSIDEICHSGGYCTVYLPGTRATQMKFLPHYKNDKMFKAISAGESGIINPRSALGPINITEVTQDALSDESRELESTASNATKYKYDFESKEYQQFISSGTPSNLSVWNDNVKKRPDMCLAIFNAAFERGVNFARMFDVIRDSDGELDNIIRRINEIPLPALVKMGSDTVKETRDLHGKLTLHSKIHNYHFEIVDGMSLGRECCKYDTLLVNHTLLSRRHVTFSFDRTAGWMVCDDDSTNGTTLNGVRLAPREYVPIRMNDTLSLTDLEFEVTIV